MTAEKLHFRRLLYLTCKMLLNRNAQSVFHIKAFWYRMQIWCFSVKKVQKLPFKVVLDDLEWKIFFVTEPWWATLKISFAVIFIRKANESFLKVKWNPTIGLEKKQFVLENYIFCCYASRKTCSKLETDTLD